MTTVLIIDDERAIRDTFSRYLRTLDYTVVTAGDGPSGIEACAQHSPDIVLCDLRMPGMDGLDVLARLTGTCAELPVLVVSGAADIGDAIQSLKRGAWDYVTKPIEDLQVLEHAIAKALERVRLLADNRRYREHLEAVNARLEQSLRRIREDEEGGRDIQFGLLPDTPGRFDGYECSRFLAPSAVLSGDFVDYFPIDDRRFGFYMADVSGHGVAAAVVTVLLKSQVERYRERLLRNGDRTILDPAALCAALNRDVLDGRHDKYLTMFYGVVDPPAATLAFANAGQYPFPYLYDGSAVRVIGGRSPPVGLFEDARYTSQTLAIPDAFALRIYSDGVLDALPQPELAARKARLHALSHDDQDDAEALARRIGLDRAAERPDDAAVLSLRRAVDHG